jgi:hypothetical protein
MASTLAFDPGTTVALFDRVFVTDSCALPGDLVVLALEGGQLQRLEVVGQQNLGRVAHDAAPASSSMYELAEVVATVALGRLG